MKTDKKIDKVLVTPDHYCGYEEWYGPVIECPRCKRKTFARGANYCPGCGVKLVLSQTVINWIKGERW